MLAKLLLVLVVVLLEPYNSCRGTKILEGDAIKALAYTRDMALILLLAVAMYGMHRTRPFLSPGRNMLALCSLVRLREVSQQNPSRKNRWLVNLAAGVALRRPLALPSPL
jgi:hypothetical protein